MLPFRHPGGASMANVNVKTSPCLIRREHGESGPGISSQQREIAKTKTETTPLRAGRNEVETEAHRTQAAERYEMEGRVSRMRSNASTSRRC